MPWLLRDGDVLASLEVADGIAARTRGLLGRDGLDGALLLRPAMQVHTLGMRFAIDIAFCDRDLNVVSIVRDMRPWRMGRPRIGVRAVIEAETGSFVRWNLAVGDALEIG
ncbi:MAG: uncharacterized protein QOI47_2427 [Actinomycetota bacterium]|jgi:uncharacterized membrane protein (UPF0127 family)|nr:uncharacterized protein [Actinomycetota bacterium]